MKVLPDAWRHRVPDAFEAKLADDQAQHPRRADGPEEPPAGAQQPPRKTLLAGGARRSMQHLWLNTTLGSQRLLVPQFFNWCPKPGSKLAICCSSSKAKVAKS